MKASDYINKVVYDKQNKCIKALGVHNKKYATFEIKGWSYAFASLKELGVEKNDNFEDVVGEFMAQAINEKLQAKD